MKSPASTSSHCAKFCLPSFVQCALLLIAFCFTPLFILPAHAQSASSPIVLKMADYMDSVVDRGVETMNAFKARVSTDAVAPAPAATTATPLKLDKINSRFIEKQDVIYDRVHHLTWSRCSQGQRWARDKGCVGTVRQYSFDQAQQLGNEQWRLPTTAELATLIDHTKKNMPQELAIDSVAFPDMDPDRLFYWSSDEENNSFAWAVLFIDSGMPGVLYRSHRYAVRLLRIGT